MEFRHKKRYPIAGLGSVSLYTLFLQKRKGRKICRREKVSPSTFNYKGNFRYSLLTGIPLSMLPTVSPLVYPKVTCESEPFDINQVICKCCWEKKKMLALF